MAIRDCLARALTVLALLGVLIAPLGESIAAPMMKAQMHQAGMSADMPCCPDEPADDSGCGGTCPFVALCVGSHISATTPVFLNGVLQLRLERSPVPVDAVPLSSRAGDPPTRPPRV
ncbi:MAG: hypothetical protein AB7F76_01595 [Parvibaculaceae bacterium]